MRIKEMISSSTDDHQFDRMMVSLSDQEEWDDEYRHSMEPVAEVPALDWYQIQDYKDFPQYQKRIQERKNPKVMYLDTDPQSKTFGEMKKRRLGPSKSFLDRIRKLCDTPQVKYGRPSKQELFEMLSKRYEQLNKLAELQIKKLESDIKERETLISNLMLKLKGKDTILVETSAKTPAPRLVLPTDENWESCAEEANRKMQEGILLMERLKDANLIP